MPEGVVPPSNPKHKLFADAFLAGLSGTKAAIHAGYSSHSARTQAVQIRNRPDVSAYIEAMQAQGSEEALSMKDKLTEELSRISFSNIGDFTTLEADGSRSIDYSRATREQLAAISGVKTKTRTIYSPKGEVVAVEKQSEFKLWDKLRAAELLGKDIGMFKEPEQKVVVDIADRLLAARQRIIGARRLSDDTVTDD